MPWTKEDNIKSAAVWLGRKVQLIEEKHNLLEQQKQNIQRANNYVAIKVVYRGSVYWVEFGEGNIGGEKNKTRPALVLSPNRLNKGHTVVVAPLSKQFQRKPNGLPKFNNHYLLEKTVYPDLERDSVVKFEDIRSIDVVRVGNHIFDVSKDDMKKMKDRLLFMYGY